jgi:hypothetical protein
MERLSRAKAIRAKCIDCCNGQAIEVTKCHIETCALWRYKSGKELKDENTPPPRRKGKTEAKP